MCSRFKSCPFEKLKELLWQEHNTPGDSRPWTLGVRRIRTARGNDKNMTEA